jgi:glycosyltransferase involved in cell wall biosynthesis
MQDLLCEYVELQDPLLSIVIPTYNRPEMVLRAVESALAQSVRQIEVIVVDDGSKTPPTLPDHPRLSLITIPENRGGAYVRNFAARAATGRWITFLDDDDLMLPNLAMVSLQAITGPCSLPGPVVVLTAKQTVDSKGRLLYREKPPSLPRGSHYSLDPMPPGTSDKCKQTFVMDRELFLGLGGFDASQCCRIHSELFLRLNLECSILGVPEVTYTFVRHRKARVSNNNRIRQRGFEQLISKHRHLYEAHPIPFSRFLHEHAVISMNCGQTAAGIRTYLRALRVDPKNESLRIARRLKRGVVNVIRRGLKSILRRI